ncbi:MAG: PHB depolymerase family esterase [Pseudomonadota bacterium]|nr:PHB depolymerase family esterase [Pseudomonadota bacterium]
MNHIRPDQMLEALILTKAGELNAATAAIQRAINGSRDAGEAKPDTAPIVATAVLEPSVPRRFLLDGISAFDAEPRNPTKPPIVEAFIEGTHSRSSQTLRYKLYTPPDSGGQKLPLVVMLHGCTQNPDDFAAGTAMNLRAREQGFYVLYPAQSQRANPSLCWSWYKQTHQQRGSGEPAFIASLTEAIIDQHNIDSRRIYVAGMSAGGAMAMIVATTYPEMYAAVGVHSGLPRGAASDVAGAMKVMKSGTSRGGAGVRAGRFGAASVRASQPSAFVPAIIFHGDRDQTVHPLNGEQLIASVLHNTAANDVGEPHATTHVQHGFGAHDRAYTRSTYVGEAGKVLAEHWLVHGAGHTWSGGQAAGSYTDASGPDATAEMLRFFFEQSPQPN